MYDVCFTNWIKNDEVNRFPCLVQQRSDVQMLYKQMFQCSEITIFMAQFIINKNTFHILACLGTKLYLKNKMAVYRSQLNQQ